MCCTYLGWEVAKDIGHISPPQGSESLLLGHSGEAVHNALVLLVRCNLFRGSLHLDKRINVELK